MAVVVADARAREASIHMIVTRADGTVEDLGVVSYWHKNPLKRLLWQLKRKFSK